MSRIRQALSYKTINAVDPQTGKPQRRISVPSDQSKPSVYRSSSRTDMGTNKNATDDNDMDFDEKPRKRHSKGKRFK